MVCALVVGGTSAASAQSAGLIERIRVRQAGVASFARAELDACRSDRACTSRDRLALLVGALSLAEGDAAGAAAVLSVSRSPRGLEAFHAWYLGDALARSGQGAAAVRHLTAARKVAPPWLARRIDVRLAEVWLDLDEPAKARPALEAAAGARQTPELLLARARAREGTRDTAKALADFTAIALRFPRHPHAEIALARRGALGGRPFTAAERLARAQALLAAGDPAQCLSELDDDAAAPAVDAARVALLRGQALLARGRERDDEGLAALSVAEAGPAPVAAEALMTRARRLMRLGDNARARAAFQSLDARYPDSAFADEAGYLGAWLAMNAGEDEAAVAELATFERRHPRSRRLDEARWFRGFSLIRLGRHVEARALLAALEVDFPRSQLVPQARYWAARAAQLQGAAPDGGVTAEPLREYRELTAAFPGSFYARLAVERLREAGERPPRLLTGPPTSPPVKTPSALGLAVALARAGLLGDAGDEVESVVGRVSGVDEAVSWGHALQALGEYGAAYGLAARLLWGAAYTQQRPEALALLYPRAFRDAVEASSSTHRLDPFFAWAIMRRESAFRPDVTSSANARGLMQVIPPTADRISDELKEPRVDPGALYGPATSIRLGTWYLAALFQRMGHPTLVAASYNGGPDAAARWVRERGDLPLDRWIEEIPYRETRGYVKQVVADYYLYRELYGAPEAHLPLSLPTPRQTGVAF
jgi:soluble lytic murein transglycosylase